MVLLVVKLSGCEIGMKVGPTLGGGTGSRGEGRVSVGWEVGIKVGPTLGDSVVRMEGTVVVGVEMRSGVGFFRRRGIK